MSERNEVAIRIRKCVPGDEAALALVGQASFLEAFAGTIDGRDVVAHCLKQHAAERYRRWLDDPATAVWIAEVEPGGAPVGYLVLTVPDLPLAEVGPRDREVKRVYVLHRFQGMRVGARLMEEAQREAAAGAVERLLLGVYSGNAAAISFYERLGYATVGTREFQVGANTYHDLILARAVAEMR